MTADDPWPLDHASRNAVHSGHRLSHERDHRSAVQDSEDVEGRPRSIIELACSLGEKEIPHEDEEATTEGSERERLDLNVVDYESPDDPENPYNWTLTRKWTNGGFISAMTFVSPLASSMFAPGVPQLMRDFHSTDSTLASLVVSIYVLGYAFGPLIIAPLSEVYGRLYVYHAANFLFVVFTIACAVADSIGSLIGFRFLAGIMGSTPITIGGGTVADMFKQEERGTAMALWSFGPLLGPVIGPVAGSYLSQAKSWRWCFWVLSMLAGVVAVGMLVFLRETYAPRILEMKARRLRKTTGNAKLRSKMASDLPRREYFVRSIVRPTKMLLFSPIVFLLSLYMAVCYGYLYLLFTTMTEVFENVYHFSPSNVGLVYIGLGVGLIGGLIVIGATLDRLLKALAKKNNGVLKPEYRLPPLIPAGLLLPCGLFLYGWSAQYAVQWMVPIIGTVLIGAGLICIFMPIMTYLIDAFTLYAASATAANTVLRSIAGALLPLAGPSMYRALGLGWGNSLLGFVALALLPVPYVFWKFGERIRTSRRFEIKF